MGKTKIEWVKNSDGSLGKTWNPVTGCSPISEGCENCYAKRMAQRLRGRSGYPEDDPFRVTFHPGRLEEPERWRKPSRIFVCSMGDMFHENVDDAWLYQIWARMIYAKGHVFMILTKRPERMQWFLHEYVGLVGDSFLEKGKHIWLGVTAENQKRADERIPILLQIPAKVRFVSIEPMLGPVDLEWYLGEIEIPGDPHDEGSTWIEGLDWVIVGAETGPRARVMRPEWAWQIRDQCQNADIPFFFKRDSEGKHWLDNRRWEEWPE